MPLPEGRSIPQPIAKRGLTKYSDEDPILRHGAELSGAPIIAKVFFPTDEIYIYAKLCKIISPLFSVEGYGNEISPTTYEGKETLVIDSVDKLDDHCLGFEHEDVYFVVLLVGRLHF